MTKRHVLFALLIAFTLSFTACANNNETQEESDSSITENKETATDSTKETNTNNKDEIPAEKSDVTQSDDVKKIPYESKQEAVAALKDHLISARITLISSLPVSVLKLSYV